MVTFLFIMLFLNALGAVFNAGVFLKDKNIFSGVVAFANILVAFLCLLAMTNLQAI